MNVGVCTSSTRLIKFIQSNGVLVSVTVIVQDTEICSRKEITDENIEMILNKNRHLAYKSQKVFELQTSL